MRNLSKRKAQLEARMAHLSQRLEQIEGDLEAAHSQDWDDRAIEVEGDEVLERLGLEGQREMALIQAALGRIAAGSFGICAKCGNPISEDRLDVLPFTPHCRHCAADA